MTDQLTDEEIKILRRIIHDEEARLWYKKILRERMKTWAIWIGAVTMAVGAVRSFITDYWLGKH